MVPAPGPGWLVVFFGLLILASEFEFAQRLLDFAKHHVSRWNDWIMAQAIWVRGLVALGTLLIVWGVIWGYLAWPGIPQFVPQWAEELLTQVPGDRLTRRRSTGRRAGRLPPRPADRLLFPSSPRRRRQGAPGRVAQLVRALASHARGQGFESLHVHRSKTRV